MAEQARVKKITRPFLYIEGEFPMLRLMDEHREIKVLLKQEEVAAPRLWEMLNSKKHLTNAELIVIVRLGRMIKDEISQSRLRLTE